MYLEIVSTMELKTNQQNYSNYFCFNQRILNTMQQKQNIQVN